MGSLLVSGAPLVVEVSQYPLDHAFLVMLVLGPGPEAVASPDDRDEITLSAGKSHHLLQLHGLFERDPEVSRTMNQQIGWHVPMDVSDC